MSERRNDFDPLDLLARAAHAQTAHLGSPQKLEAQVTQALVVANAQRHRGERMRTVFAYAVAAAVLVAFVARDYLRGSAVTAPVANRSEATAATHIALATGDALTTTGGAEFDMHGFSATDRHVKVSHGTVLFDVVHLPNDVPFEVETADARVLVRGTVFSVTYEADTTRVQVFEGRVDVVRADGTHSLAAGDRISSQADSDRIAWSSPLMREGELAARRRATHAHSGLAAAPATGTSPAATPLTNAAAPPASPEAQRVGIDEAQALLEHGNYRAAFEAAATAREGDGAWLMLRADALRGLDRLPEAASTYDRAAQHLSPSRATVAGFSAARLHLDRLDDPNAAIRSLMASRADESGSPVEEPAFVVRLRALRALHNDAELARLGSIYLARFPDGSAREWVQHAIAPRP